MLHPATVMKKMTYVTFTKKLFLFALINVMHMWSKKTDLRREKEWTIKLD